MSEQADIVVLLPFIAAFLVLVVAVYAKFIFRKTYDKPVDEKKQNWVIDFEPMDDSKVESLAVFLTGTVVAVIVTLSTIIGWIILEAYLTDIHGWHVYRIFYIAAGIFFLGQMLLSSFCKPVKGQANGLLKLHVLIPVFNEDENSLKNCLESCLSQGLVPSGIHVVDDCSTESDYSEVKEWFLPTAKEHGVMATWDRLPQNGGKRIAQIKGFKNVPEDPYVIIVTTDSDSILDPKMLEEGIKPFNDSKVSSVAGLMIAKNVQNSWLTRMYDLIMVCQQLIGRGAVSLFGNVLVNSGPSAFYRYDVVKNAINNQYHYEEFLKQEVRCSDDSYLTLCALLMGHTVFQPSAIVLSDMPTKLSHHIRQQLRWERGSTVRGIWRLKYLLDQKHTIPGFLRQLLGWISFWTIFTIAIIVITNCIANNDWVQLLLMTQIAFALSIGYYTRYLHVKRLDIRNNWTGYLLTPIATLWASIVLKIVRLYATFTCHKITHWGTRTNIEDID
ncbi:glycosyltransferase [Candidatus Enterococcus clewellii]|uniref:Hyaluronan synthase n=1 Tax=Candidatus Enterococcus clewellii TaxID=1834193 RepID=A0A242K4Q4_9ENTE|nr:glycosyltransferase [Enterococcus sp. 9E7_DIV0242]OTP14509.1 hypothetical protein A5888_002610 [Enterococcus sp. 9E7_DIV0242]